jgi:hypothetical protein
MKMPFSILCTYSYILKEKHVVDFPVENFSNESVEILCGNVLPHDDDNIFKITVHNVITTRLNRTRKLLNGIYKIIFNWIKLKGSEKLIEIARVWKFGAVNRLKLEKRIIELALKDANTCVHMQKQFRVLFFMYAHSLDK